MLPVNQGSIQRIKRKDDLMRGAHKAKRFSCVAADIGNATMNIITPEYEISAPHAIRQLDAVDLAELGIRGDEHPFVYWVNGVPFMISDTVSKEGAFAVKMGSERHTAQYVGAILAILMFNGFDTPPPLIHLMMNHAPRDVVYRPDIIAATQGTFLVDHMGQSKKFYVGETACYDEPVGGWLNALMTADGEAIARTDLTAGRWAIFDIGGFTTDTTVAVNGKIDTSVSNNSSETYGMIDVLSRFERLCRLQQKDFFRPLQKTDSMQWREAFA